MTDGKCSCGEEHREGGGAACRAEEIFSYWCKSCLRSVPEKRCPYCGLKTQKKKEAGAGFPSAE